MESRRSSVISNTSVRKRKYSTDRHLRQAELSARLEEGRPLILQTTAETNENPGEPETRVVRSLTRADSLISPFEFHPGHRLRRYSTAIPGFNADFKFGTAEAIWAEPTPAQQEDIERRAAVTRRVETTSLDLTPAQAHIARGLSQHLDRNPIGRWARYKAKFSRPSEPSIMTGIQMAATMHTALGLSFIAQKSPDWLRRQKLHVFEYKINKTKSFFCDSNSAFADTEALKQHLCKTNSTNSPQLIDGTGLRLIHIRNHVEAFKYMDEAFSISSPDIHYNERGFKNWMQEDRDSRRSSNMTIRWRPGFDINRRVICMAIGIDLGSSGAALEDLNSKQTKMSQHDQSLFQKRRIALYLQRSLTAAAPNPKVMQFNSRGYTFSPFAEQDTLVICEYSSDATSEISHTASLLALAPSAGLPQTTSAAIMASAISHVFNEIVLKWQSQIAAIHQPFADLEELIDGNPADITHSDKVWAWLRYLQNMLKLASRHLKAIQTFQDDFEVFAELNDVEWLDDTLSLMKGVADTLRTDYIEPLEHMIDLMYKSVTIRDSRLSLEIGTSLWRLSWITFIFLPMTFLVGFFGMNVDTFHNDPSIKWYFVGLIPLSLSIVAFWFSFKQYVFEFKK